MSPRVLAGCALALALVPPSSAHARRWAVIVGNNVGDADDAPLRYAETDARRLADVLAEVGGVHADDEVLLLGRSAADVAQTLKSLEEKLRLEAQPADQLIVYFSGHADEGELHLGGGRLPLAELNAYAQRVPVGVAVLILDSCRSGSVTRLKGLKPLGGTAVSVELPEVRGRVVIGSSGPDELAQESDAVGGSFFTHHLLAALRGLADTSHDGVVTLEEAYTYAYAHTVESTFATEGGVQHPSFHVDLRGQGALALTAPGRARGKLRLELADVAEVLVVKWPSNELLGEFVSPAGAAELAVPPGAYAVRVRRGAQSAEREITVPEGGSAVLHDGDFELTAVAPTRSRGPMDTVRLAVGGSAGLGLTRNASTGVGFGIGAELDSPGWPSVAKHLAVDLAARSSDATGEVTYRERTLDLRAGPGWVSWLGPARLRLAPELGAIGVLQDRLPGNLARNSLAPELGASAALELGLVGPVAVFADAFGGGALLNTVVGAELRPRVDGVLGLAVRI
ncbi:MAG: caspase family protein [Deltaproteobacteria bacterium]|nr:caspase family protein [Deltaproteobacteria bacterium]